MKPFKLIVLSNLPGYGVGYSTLVKYLIPFFEKKVGKGNIAFVSNFGFQGEQIHHIKEWPDIPIYGHGINGFNEISMLDYYRHFEADLMLVIWDIWALIHIPKAGEEGKITLVPYLPIDTEGVSEDMNRACNGCFKIIPMGSHSENLMRKNFNGRTYPNIPCGVNTQIYRPLWNNIEEKGKLKSELNFDSDCFVIGLLGDIKGDRKAWAESIEGLALFRQRHPEIKLRLYFHTMITKTVGDQFDITLLLNKYNLQDISRATDPLKYRIGIDEEQIAKYYNAFDIFLQASMGEGFGLSFVEAQACGIPVIGTDFSNMPYVVGKNTGYLVRPIFKRMRPDHEKKAIPDPEDICAKLELLYNDIKAKGCEYFREEGVKFASQFDWENIYPLWDAAIDRLKEDINKACLKPKEPSELLIERSKEVFIIEPK